MYHDGFGEPGSSITDKVTAESGVAYAPVANWMTFSLTITLEFLA